jgi:hypothetical protein
MQSLLVVNVNLLNETPDVSWMRPVRDSDHLSLKLWPMHSWQIASWTPAHIPDDTLSAGEARSDI